VGFVEIIFLSVLIKTILYYKINLKMTEEKLSACFDCSPSRFHLLLGLCEASPSVADVVGELDDGFIHGQFEVLAPQHREGKGSSSSVSGETFKSQFRYRKTVEAP